jgi:hypothetical protein
MNTSQFTDKQIMDLMNHQPKPQAEESSTSHINGDNSTTKEEILASYDFQPICTFGSSPPRASSGTGTVTATGSVPNWGSFVSRMDPSNLNVMQYFPFAFPFPLSCLFPFQAFWTRCAIIRSLSSSLERNVQFGLTISNWTIGIL